jgi:hypothetical protein
MASCQPLLGMASWTAGLAHYVMKPHWKVTLWYLLFGAAWIFFTDQLLETQTRDVRALTFLQTSKGWFYVALSGLLLFHLIKRAWERHMAQEREKQEVFCKTVEGAHHILLNYLNQMQLVTMEAERCKEFDPELLQLSREISNEAASALMKLEAVERLTAADIHDAVHGVPQK